MRSVWDCEKCFGLQEVFQICENWQFELLECFSENVYVVAKVYWRLMYTLAPKFEANVYFIPKLGG